jgi:uncharacterized membrane protein
VPGSVSTQARAINNAGQIVGSYIAASQTNCFIREVDPVVGNCQRGISVASFTIGDDYLIDGPEEFFADSVDRARHFVFVVRVSDDKQDSNRFSLQLTWRRAILSHRRTGE